MFGRHPRLAIDAFLGLEREPAKPKGGYVDNLRARLDFAYKVATTEARKSSERHKHLYDRKVRESLLKPGDRVLIKNVRLDKKEKLADRWLRDPFIVVSQPNPDIPVYRLRREDRVGPEKVLHRNLLLPFMSLSQALPEPVLQRNNHPAQRKPHLRSRSIDPSVREDSDSDSDSSSGVYVIPQLRSGRSGGPSPRNRPLDPAAPEFIPRPLEEHSTSTTLSGSLPEEPEDNLPADASQISGRESLDVPRTPPRRSGRIRRPPNWFRTGDWVM